MILKAIIDIAGKPESAVSQALDKTEERIEGIENVKVLELAKAEPELNENTNGMYTAFLDLEIECSTPRVAMQFIIDYLPTSVEIIGVLDNPHSIIAWGPPSILDETT